ncbi:hypothetical protein BD769DRAFT_1609219 [Suillus cothurnatus]|nr:hypothetical protein BD769DRAFT_1609219 [Suillus cothurnatus]
MNRRYAFDFTMAVTLCAILFCIPFVRASLPGLNSTHILTLDASDCPSCNTRTLWDIISSCGLTLFACTWTAIHPNIPDKDEGIVYATSRRLLLMLIAFLAPEFVVTWAAWQFLHARRVAKTFNDEFGWTLTHGFFAWMGGFMLYVDGRPRGTLTPDELLQFVRDKLVEMPVITEAEIKDRSKGDTLSKWVAILQLVWFVIQLIARYIQDLPITLLEIDTLGVAALTCISYGLWLNKPKDARLPYIVHWKDSTAPLADSLGSEYVIILAKIVLICMHSMLLLRYRTQQSAGLTLEVIIIIIGCISGMAFGVIHCLGWNFLFATHAEKIFWRVASIGMPFSFSFSLIFYFLFDLYMISEFIRRWLGLTHPPSMSPTSIYRISRTPMSVAIVYYYIPARVSMIVLMFLSLRSLPPGAYDTVTWTKFIPHVNL